MPGEHPEPLDFAEAWAGQGASFVGPTGWAYGHPEVLNYQEALMADFAREMFTGLT